MSEPRYLWRQLSIAQREELLTWRKGRGNPWHSPPHRPNYGHLNFLISGACFEHKPYIGLSPERMDSFANELLVTLNSHVTHVVAWCVLPNHYHALVEVPDILNLLRSVGQFHGRMSYRWNTEEQMRGRQVFHRCAERSMRSERHFWATVNYVHHNPVHHAYVERWSDWPWSSASEYLTEIGQEDAALVWREYPIETYGQKWDPPAL